MAMQELESLIEECISKQGVHLIDLVMRGEGKDKLVELYVDSEQGVTTDICSKISREVDGLIGTVGVVKGSYRLSVSSPGITRPLKYSWQYKKHIGREFEVKVQSQEGIRSIVGKLESMDDRAIVLAIGKKSEMESIVFDNIMEARVRAPW
jgi:ribosome maturation factor RimP